MTSSFTIGVDVEIDDGTVLVGIIESTGLGFTAEDDDSPVDLSEVEEAAEDEGEEDFEDSVDETTRLALKLAVDDEAALVVG